MSATWPLRITQTAHTPVEVECRPELGQFGTQVRSAGDRFGAWRMSSGGKPQRRQRVVRHRDMRKPTLIVLVGLAALLGESSCSSTTLPSVAEVTGFRSVSSPVAGSSPSGPVTVRVAGNDASRLAQLVSRLPSVPQSQVQCEEPLGLRYRIVFGAGSVAQSREVVDGYECAAGVTVAVAGQAISWRRDANCTLIRAVRHVLPGRAKATQRLAIGCGS